MTLTVFLPKPSHISYGEAMNQVRMWLDYRKVHASGFKLAPNGQPGFQITFSNQDDAARFQNEFGSPPPPQAAASPTSGTEESPSP